MGNSVSSLTANDVYLKSEIISNRWKQHSKLVKTLLIEKENESDSEEEKSSIETEIKDMTTIATTGNSTDTACSEDCISKDSIQLSRCSLNTFTGLIRKQFISYCSVISASH